MRPLWFQSGISMVQGMVISSVLAGSALIASRLITTQKMAIKSAESKDQIQQLHKLIFSTLQNREHCLATLASVAGTLTPGTAQTLPITNIMTRTAPGASTMQMTTNATGFSNTAATYMNGQVCINSMSLNTTTNLGDPQPIVINYRRLDKNTSAASVRAKAGFGGSSISKTVWVRLQRASSASTAINGCYAVEVAGDSDSGSGNSDLNKEFCERLGTGGSLYTWDTTRNVCVLKNNICAAKQVFEGIDTNGTAICRSINDYLPYLMQPGANPCGATKSAVKIVRNPVTNKVSIECESGPTGCTAPAHLYWSVGNNSCYAHITATGNEGDIRNQASISSRSSLHNPGNGVFRCTGGNWIVQPASTCLCKPFGHLVDSPNLCGKIGSGSSGKCCSGYTFFEPGLDCMDGGQMNRFHDVLCQ